MKFKPVTLTASLLLVLLAPAARAHCDGLDGPVVQAGRRALDSGDLKPALIWVRAQDEPEIKSAFARALAVRKDSPAARELADLYFFETLVRVHRAGEGAPYTGLRPAGRDPGPAISLADKAAAGGSVDPLVALLTGAVREGVTERFHHVSHAKAFDKTDVPAGREYVKAYVEFLHYVEAVHQAAAGRSGEHKEP